MHDQYDYLPRAMFRQEFQRCLVNRAVAGTVGALPSFNIDGAAPVGTDTLQHSMVQHLRAQAGKGRRTCTAECR